MPQFGGEASAQINRKEWTKIDIFLLNGLTFTLMYTYSCLSCQMGQIDFNFLNETLFYKVNIMSRLVGVDYNYYIKKISPIEYDIGKEEKRKKKKPFQLSLIFKTFGTRNNYFSWNRVNYSWKYNSFIYLRRRKILIVVADLRYTFCAENDELTLQSSYEIWYPCWYELLPHYYVPFCCF